MTLRRSILAVAGASLVAATALAGPAGAGVQGKPEPDRRKAVGAAAVAASACSMQVGAVNAAGMSGGYNIVATRPVQVGEFVPYKLFGIRASATWYYYKEPTRNYFRGLILQGSNLYAAYEIYKGSSDVPTVSATKVGTGWSGFSTIATSNFVQGTTPHRYLYGLHTNGSLYRYNVNGPVRSYGSAPGYRSFKTITVIAETATYDTLLATTKTGALWTIRVPVTAPLKATLKQVRTTGFKAYEQLIAQRCGATSTLLTAFDNDANTATVYAVSRATGASTLINTIDTFPATFDAPTHHLYTASGGPQLVGE